MSGCPSDRLAARDSDGLRLLVADLARRGARSVRLVANGSPRSRAAEGIKSAAQRYGINVLTSGHSDATIAVTRWAAARTALTGAAGAPLHGTWLAPWLVYAATADFHVMPMGEGGAAHIQGPGWLAGGSLTPVSGVLGAGGASALRPQDALPALGRD